MALTTVSKVRLLTNITDSQVSDADIDSLITEATKELYSQINVKVIREFVVYIDETRDNEINNTNTEFYVQNWKGKYLGDYNLDGIIDTDDVKVILRDSQGEETEATVSSIDIEDCKITLSSAPGTDKDMFITYAYTVIDPTTPDPLLGLAATYLVAAYAYLKRDVGLDGTQRFGNVTISTKLSSSYGEFYQRYLETMKKIKALSLSIQPSWRESNVKI